MKTIQLGHNPEAAAAVATEFLMDGGVVLMPMDTSYGLAVDAANQSAVQQLFFLKDRPPDQAVSVVVGDREQAEDLTRFSPQAARLWDVFMPGPLTLVLPLQSGAKITPQVSGGGQTLGLRQPLHQLCELVAERFGRPFTATSANRTGQPSAFSVEEFLAQLPEELVPHLVIDGGGQAMVKPSTVVEVSDAVNVLREGAISEQLIREALT